MENNVIEIADLVKVYNQKHGYAFKALKGISLTIRKGEMVAIIGRSGAGKSTLLHVLACIDSYEGGEYRLNGILIKNMSEKELAVVRNQNIGMIMQDFALVEDFTALENVMIPLDFSKKKWKDRKKQIALKKLEQVGILELAPKMVNQLSGGQKQRVAIARALANDPDVILADEPTGALDSKTSDEIVQLLRELNGMGKTVIVVTHEPSIGEACNRLIEISDGKIKS